MASVYALIHRYARAHTPLLLVGATGTGKTTVAELVHALGGRAGPFVAHTARELDPNLERSQLFGHERGAFTGAGERHVGWLEEAGAGTLLLDDFHHLRRGSQMALLRALDRGAFRPLNARRDLAMRCRLIVGLEDRPEALLGRGRLMAELPYRWSGRSAISAAISSTAARSWATQTSPTKAPAGSSAPISACMAPPTSSR